MKHHRFEWNSRIERDDELLKRAGGHGGQVSSESAMALLFSC